jgi:hypothetical protein
MKKPSLHLRAFAELKTTDGDGLVKCLAPYISPRGLRWSWAGMANTIRANRYIHNLATPSNSGLATYLSMYGALIYKIVDEPLARQWVAEFHNIDKQEVVDSWEYLYWYYDEILPVIQAIIQ